MQRLVSFISRAARIQGGQFSQKDQLTWQLKIPPDKASLFTTDRELAVKNENIALVGLEHPVIRDFLTKYSSLPNKKRAVAGKIEGIISSGLLYLWLVQTQGKDGQISKYIVPIAITENGNRAPWLEKLGESLLTMQEISEDAVHFWKKIARQNKQKISEILYRDLQYSGIIEDNTTYSSTLLSIYGIQN